MGIGCEALEFPVKQPGFDVIKLSVQRPTEKNLPAVLCFFFFSPKDKNVENHVP